MAALSVCEVIRQKKKGMAVGALNFGRIICTVSYVGVLWELFW